MQTDREPTIRLALTPEQACSLLEAVAVAIDDGEEQPALRDIWRQTIDRFGELTVSLQDGDVSGPTEVASYDHKLG